MRAPTEEEFQEINGKKYAVLDVHVDCETAGGPGKVEGQTCTAGQELSEIVSAGMVFIASKTQAIITQQEFFFKPLLDRVSPVQVESFWMQPKNVEEWKKICENGRPRVEVLDSIRSLLKSLTDLGWTLMFLARPVAFDWYALKQAFTTAGVAILEERLKTEELTQEQIFDQICTPYSLVRGLVRVPDYYNARNNSCFPFGFGGATQATDIGQRMGEMAEFLGIESFDFRKPLAKLHQRELTHNGLQDAIDQARVWYEYRRLVNAWKQSRAMIVDFAIAASKGVDLEASVSMLASLGDRAKASEEALKNFLQ